MMRNFLVCIEVLVIFQACHSGRTITVSESLEDNVIATAIANFQNAGKIYKRDSVFMITIKDLSPKQDVLVIGILRLGGKLLLTKDAKVGSKGILPSRYLEKDGKLYLWRDSSFPLSEEALAIYSKYNILQDDNNGSILLPSHEMDESQKGIHYYFCRIDHRKYKRVITNISLGNYPPPKLNCKN